MKIDLIGGSYQQKYKDANSQRTINWYINYTTEAEQNKTTKALYPFPGLSLYTELTGRYFRGLFTARSRAYNRCFAIVDNILYEIFDNQTSTALGTLTNIPIGVSKIYMTVNANNQLGIWDINASYVYSLNAGTLTEITDAQFPGYASSADYVDGYSVITSNDPALYGAVWYSDVNDMTAWTGTNTFSPTFRAAPAIAIATNSEEIFVFTSETIETYYNDGTTPYSRVPKSTIYIGLVAKESLVSYQDGFLFIGMTRFGQKNIYYYDKQSGIQIVSSPSINWRINDLNEVGDDAYAFLQHSKDGHIFYYLTIPEMQTTLVYDLSNKEWIERQSKQPNADSNGDENYREFRGRHYTNFNGKNLYGDLYSGKVLIEDYNVFTEDSCTIKRQRLSQHYSDLKKLISVSSLEIDGNVGYGALSGQGSTPILMVSTATDGGYTFSDERNMFLGQQGNHLFRARLENLGSGRDWVVDLTLTDPIDLMIQTAIATGSISNY